MDLMSIFLYLEGNVEYMSTFSALAILSFFLWSVINTQFRLNYIILCMPTMPCIIAVYITLLNNPFCEWYIHVMSHLIDV